MPVPPFSCVGYRIAIAEMVLTIGNLYRCFDLDLAGPLDLTPQMSFVLNPRESVQVRLRPRRAAAALS